MFERTRRALDIGGHEIVVIERNAGDYNFAPDGTIRYRSPAKFYGPDGSQLIPEGKGFYRTPFGVRYQLAN